MAALSRLERRPLGLSAWHYDKVRKKRTEMARDWIFKLACRGRHDRLVCWRVWARVEIDFLEVKRDIYGIPLPPGAIARMGSAQWRNPGQGPRLMALSPNGKLLATTSFGPTIQLFDAGSGIYLRALPELVPQTIACTGLAFCPDGASIVSGYVGGVLRWNDVAKGDELPRRSDRARQMDGSCVLCRWKNHGDVGRGSTDPRVGRHETEHIRDLTGFEGTIRCAGISADGNSGDSRQRLETFYGFGGRRMPAEVERPRSRISSRATLSFPATDNGWRWRTSWNGRRFGTSTPGSAGSSERLRHQIASSPTDRILGLSRPHPAPHNPHGGVIVLLPRAW